MTPAQPRRTIAAAGGQRSIREAPATRNLRRLLTQEMEVEVPLILVAVLAALIIVALLRVLVARRPGLPYRKRDHLLTAAERSFYGVLLQVIDERYHVAWKVRIADVLWIPGSTTDRQRHLNRILAKHLDFVLCDPESSAPILAIELDDSSHREDSRMERDSFVNAALNAAELPLLRVPVRRSYSPQELTELIRLKLG